MRKWIAIASLVLAACGGGGGGGMDAAMMTPADLSSTDQATTGHEVVGCSGNDLGTQQSGNACSFCPASCNNGFCGACSVPSGYYCHYPIGVVCSCSNGNWECGSA